MVLKTLSMTFWRTGFAVIPKSKVVEEVAAAVAVAAAAVLLGIYVQVDPLRVEVWTNGNILEEVVVAAQGFLEPRWQLWLTLPIDVSLQTWATLVHL